MANKVKLPTLDQLNKVSCSKIVLMQLRIMNTSDLAFHYMLYSKSTIRAIVYVNKSLLDTDVLCEGNDLTLEEKTELLGYFNILEEYCGDA